MRVSKHALKRLRHWSKFHSEVTVYDAHAHLKKTILTTADYQSIADLELCTVEIKNYLIKFCGYEMTRGVKIQDGKPYRIFKNTGVAISNRRALDNYVAAMTAFFD